MFLNSRNIEYQLKIATIQIKLLLQQISMNVRLLVTIVHKLAVIQLDHTPVLVELDIKIMDMEIVLVRV